MINFWVASLRKLEGITLGEGKNPRETGGIHYQTTLAMKLTQIIEANVIMVINMELMIILGIYVKIIISFVNSNTQCTETVGQLWFINNKNIHMDN